MSATSVSQLGTKAKQILIGCIGNADFSMGMADYTEGAHFKRITSYADKNNDWQLWIDVLDVLKGVSGANDCADLRKAIIVALALIHGKSKTDLQVKLSTLAALGQSQLVEEYKAVLAKAGKKAVTDLGIQLTLRNFESGPEANASKAVEALKLVLQRLPEVNQRLQQVPSISKEAVLFETWFGDPKLTHKTVSDNFAVMTEAIEHRHVILSFDGSGCQEGGTGGYVYKSKTTDKQLCNIHLCRRKFADNAPAGRVAGTIMHELSHAAAKTADVGGLISYGERICKELATSDPAKAANNADNYRWYAFPEVSEVS